MLVYQSVIMIAYFEHPSASIRLVLVPWFPWLQLQVRVQTSASPYMCNRMLYVCLATCVVGNSSRHHCIMEQGLTFKHGTSLSVWRSLLEMGCKLRHIYIYMCMDIYIYHLVRLEITSCFHLDMRANVIRFTVIFGENTFQKGIPKPIKEDENKHMTDPSLLLLLIITTVIIALIIHIPIEVFFFSKIFVSLAPNA